jgi:hypothetical protein
VPITVNEHGQEAEEEVVDMNEAAGHVPEVEKKALMQVCVYLHECM